MITPLDQIIFQIRHRYENLDAEIFVKAVELHMQSVDKYKDYYSQFLGEKSQINEFKFGKEEKDIKYRSEFRVNSGFPNSIVLFYQGLLLGNPIEFEGKYKEEAERFLEDVGFEGKKQEITKHMGAQGKVAVLLYLQDNNQQPEYNILVVPPEEYLFIEDTKGNPEVFIRFFYIINDDNERETLRLEVYDNERVRIFDAYTKTSIIHLKEEIPNPFGVLPVVEFVNPNGLPDFYRANDMILTWELYYTTIVADLAAKNKDMIVINGFIQPKHIDQAKEDGILLVNSQLSVKDIISRITFAEITFDGSLEEKITNAIYYFSQMPNPNQRGFERSGESQKWLLTTTKTYAVLKLGSFNEGIKNLLKIWGALENYEIGSLKVIHELAWPEFDKI